MHKLLAITLSLFVSATNYSFAQSKVAVHVVGKVTNEEQEPIASASVFLMTESSKVIIKTGLTNESGVFEISNVPKGRYYVEVTSVGYETAKSQPFDFSSEQIVVEDLVLLKQSESIEEVTVKGEVPLVKNVDGKLVMDVANSTVAAGNTGFDVLKRAPGVSVDMDENILLMGRQGINVTIDGRQTFMSGEQLTTFLKSLDGSQIKSIEVGTNREAKEDAEGSAGSINIVLKKNNTEGFNGNFLVSGAHGKHPLGNTSLSLNYKKNNTTVFGSYAYTHNKRQFDLLIDRIVGQDDATEFNQDASMIELDKTHNYRVGMEYKTSERNTMLFQFSGINNNENSENSSLTLMGVPNMATDSILTSSTIGNVGMNRYTLNLNNEFLTDTLGGRLTVDFDLTRFRNPNHTDYHYIMTDANGAPLYDQEFERSRMPTNIDINVGKIDYVAVIKGVGKFQTGLKYSRVKSDNDLQFEHLINDQWQDYEGRPNHFIYTEQVSAGYVDYSREVGKWSLKAGLRGEHTFSDGNSITLNSRVKRDYFDLFPSASVSRALSENHLLSLSYSKKITRPNYRYLNPFQYFIDRFTYMQGNPYLKPQYTHGMSLNYTLMKMFNFTLGHDITLDAVTESMGQDEESKRSWVTNENLGRNTLSYLNINTPYRLGKIWSMNNNMTLARMHFKGPIAGSYVDLGSFFFQLNNMSTFKINDQLSAETSLNYQAPFLYNIYKFSSRWNLDAGLNYNFKDQRSSLKFAVADIFRTARTRVTTQFSVFDSRINQYNDNQNFRLTYTFKFGNLKQSIRKKDINTEESQRAQ